jgi:hypothetical protein
MFYAWCFAPRSPDKIHQHPPTPTTTTTTKQALARRGVLVSIKKNRFEAINYMEWLINLMGEHEFMKI